MATGYPPPRPTLLGPPPLLLGPLPPTLGRHQGYHHLGPAPLWAMSAVDADPARGASAAAAAAAGDVISKLVGIYGSKELFINEYRCGTGIIQ